MKKPYQELIEHTIFILLGQIYEEKKTKISEYFNAIPKKYKQYVEDAIACLLHEEWIFGKDISTQCGIDISNPLMTQKGREWYQEQVIHNRPKWEKLFKFVGKYVLEKAIEKVF